MNLEIVLTGPHVGGISCNHVYNLLSLVLFLIVIVHLFTVSPPWHLSVYNTILNINYATLCLSSSSDTYLEFTI